MLFFPAKARQREQSAQQQKKQQGRHDAAAAAVKSIHTSRRLLERPAT